jgi:cell wall-associated NlpC family hydrolase
MLLTGCARKAALLGAAVVLLTGLAVPAGAVAAPFSPNIAVPAAPEIPSTDDTASAKASEAATADQVTRIERNLDAAANSQHAAFAAALQANNAYSDALVELAQRSSAAAVASAKATAAREQQDRARKQVGQLAGDLYRNGGLNPSLGTFLSGNGETLQRTATLQAISASRSRTFEAADAAAQASQSLTTAAEDATKAAGDAARTAEARMAQAEEANAAQAKAVADAKAQRTVLVDQLAELRNTTVALESVRVEALDRQREDARLAAAFAAAERAAQVPSGSPAAPAAAAPAPATAVPAPVPAPTPPAPAPAAAAPAPAPAPPPAPVAPAPAPAPAPSIGSGTYEAAISVALGKVGAPYYYQYGGAGPYGFDCSGLVQASFAAAGRYVPRTAAQQYAAAPVHVPISQARRGDLLVWGSPSNFYHVAIYLGNGQVVQALNPQEGIAVTPLSAMAGMELYSYAARY